LELIQRFDQVSNVADLVTECAPRQIEPVKSRDILEVIEREMLSELGHSHLSKYARSGNATAHGTLRSLRSHDTDVHVKLETGRDDLKYACLILADACLRCSALVTELVGRRDVVLEADLRQSMKIKFA
jgi:hypothetical protein